MMKAVIVLVKEEALASAKYATRQSPLPQSSQFVWPNTISYPLPPHFNGSFLHIAITLSRSSQTLHVAFNPLGRPLATSPHALLTDSNT
ncbi:hypothetical protein VNO77_07198 [Canavalia gladiata]|uniref:Uncharacterized protein n=1 Tax=Canavalia gladiata TaxID=3824 RepID=A0AAN9ME32_CANGL